MSAHGKETRSAFIFHKPGNNTSVICTAAVDVRWYSISEGVSFSLCKVSSFHLKVIYIHFEKKIIMKLLLSNGMIVYFLPVFIAF